jgi:hypothetical protein
VCERRLRKAHQLIAVKATLMLETFVDSHLDLAVEAVPACINRGADDGGERGIDQELAAHYGEDSLLAWVTGGGMLDKIELAASQIGT